MQGNVANATGGSPFILGGAWNSQSYLFSNADALPDFDRSSTNGFRCVRNTASLPQAAMDPIPIKGRDFSTAKPVSDEVFRAYEAMYAYDKEPLNAKVEGTMQETADWREEKITFDTAYANGRMAAYLFLPKDVRPPYETVVFFPSNAKPTLASSLTRVFLSCTREMPWEQHLPKQPRKTKAMFYQLRIFSTS